MHACWICSVVYIGCYVHVIYEMWCTYGVVCMLYMWCCVHDCTSGVVTCGVMYMSFMCYCVHVVLHTHCTGGAMYMWNFVHSVQVVPWTCVVVHTLCGWCGVQVVLCTSCTYGTGVRVVLCSCHTWFVVVMLYYVCALCSCGIVTCVFPVLYFTYIFVFCLTPCVVVLMYCVVKCQVQVCACVAL